MRLALKLGFFYANRLAATGRLVRFYGENVKQTSNTNQNSYEFLHKASLLSQGVPTAKQCPSDNYNRYDRKCQLFRRETCQYSIFLRN